MSTVKCISCGKPMAKDDEYCGACGTHRPLPIENSCINPSCPHHGAPIDEKVFHCTKCGKATKIGSKIEKLT